MTQTGFIFQTSSPFVAGVDEAGRGPLAGPVYAAAVILDPDNPVDGLNDSKKLTAKKRAELETLIRERALSWSVATASVDEIDEINILQATFLAMKRAVEGLHRAPEHVYVDGNQCPPMSFRVESVVNGDSLVPAISAASILAKEARDREMREWATRYPEYGFERHMGYGTRAHMAALQLHGSTPIHRKSFAPVKKIICS